MLEFDDLTDEIFFDYKTSKLPKRQKRQPKQLKNHYTPAGGKITLTTGSDNNRTIVSVEDNGIGIASHHIPRLTERFYRADIEQSREKGGTGLGLAITKHIISHHRGELKINSRQGHGSIFSVLLSKA